MFVVAAEKKATDPEIGEEVADWEVQGFVAVVVAVAELVVVTAAVAIGLSSVSYDLEVLWLHLKAFGDLYAEEREQVPFAVVLDEIVVAVTTSAMDVSEHFVAVRSEVVELSRIVVVLRLLSVAYVTVSVLYYLYRLELLFSSNAIAAVLGRSF